MQQLQPQLEPPAMHSNSSRRALFNPTLLLLQQQQHMQHQLRLSCLLLVVADSALAVVAVCTHSVLAATVAVAVAVAGPLCPTTHHGPLRQLAVVVAASLRCVCCAWRGAMACGG
jgi:hypothetical protein